MIGRSWCTCSIPRANGFDILPRSRSFVKLPAWRRTYHENRDGDHGRPIAAGLQNVTALAAAAEGDGRAAQHPQRPVGDVHGKRHPVLDHLEPVNVVVETRQWNGRSECSV